MKPIIKKLKNGMSAILIPQEGVKSATVYVFSRVGSRYETKNINGASHFIEHLMFKGTKRRPSAQDISRELDAYGAAYNAYTSKDHTAYFIKISSDKVDKAADLLHDMVFCSAYDPKEIERERGVIIEEINMYEDNPVMRIDMLMQKALFPHSTLGWEEAGPRSVIRNISVKELIAYRDAYYIPSRVTIAVAGDVPKNIMAVLNRTFGTVKKNQTKKDRAFTRCTTPKKLHTFAVEKKKTEQTQVAIGFYGAHVEHKDVPAIKVLAIILGGYMSSRLFTEVRERRGLCYSVSASHESYEDTGVFGIYAGLDSKRLALAMKTIYSELDLVKEKLVSEEELTRAKDHVKGTLALAFEDSAVQASWFGREWMFRKKLEMPDERIAQLSAVTREQIRRVANIVLRPDRMAVAAIGPLAKGKGLDKKLNWE